MSHTTRTDDQVEYERREAAMLREVFPDYCPECERLETLELEDVRQDGAIRVFQWRCQGCSIEFETSGR